MNQVNLGRKFEHTAYAIELHYSHGNPAIVTQGWRPGGTRPRLFPSRNKARQEARHYRGVCDRVVVRRVSVTVLIAQEVR